jgi:hypothetical protein
MKNRWGKGEPVNLSDLLKITPVANEIMQLSEELNMSVTDVMWIVVQIIGNNDIDMETYAKILEGEGEAALEDDWEELDIPNTVDGTDQAAYTVNVKINNEGRFPEIAFRAGINDKEDIHYFFDMISEMLDKLE